MKRRKMVKGGFAVLSVLSLLACDSLKADCATKSEIVPVTLPQERVQTIEELGYTPDEYRSKAVQEASYAGNAGWDVSSLAISPDYELVINGVDVPVYCTPVYVNMGRCGALQSFAMIDVVGDDVSLDVKLTAKDFFFSGAQVQPASLGIVPETEGQTIQCHIQELGNYTFLVCDEEGEADQQHALVLAVRRYVDEEKEIEAYKQQYGEEKVIVYEAGTHMVDYVHIQSDDTVIYLRRGSLLVMKHVHDIDSDSDNQNKGENGAELSNGWGLNRYPAITANGKNNIRIVGRGTIDGGLLDWHERRGIMVSNGTGFLLEGINLVNFPEWGVISYVFEDVTVRDVLLFGFKTNSDAFALCNTQNAAVTNCFARTGDDMFEVKTLNSSGEDISSNIVYSKCVAWGSKARAFGVIAEVEQDVENITFRDCAVIYRDAIWNNSLLGSLVVIHQMGAGNISNITFENIDIYCDYGRAINVSVMSGSDPKLSNICFKNVRYRSYMPNRLAADSNKENAADIRFEKVYASDELLTARNVETYTKMSGERVSLTVPNYFERVPVKLGWEVKMLY